MGGIIQWITYLWLRYFLHVQCCSTLKKDVQSSNPPVVLLNWNSGSLYGCKQWSEGLITFIRYCHYLRAGFWMCGALGSSSWTGPPYHTLPNKISYLDINYWFKYLMNITLNFGKYLLWMRQISRKNLKFYIDTYPLVFNIFFLYKIWV